MATTTRRRRTRGLGETSAPTRAQEEMDDLQLALVQGAIVLAGVGLVGGGAYYFVRKAIVKGTQTRTERKALSSGVDPGTFALQLHTSMNPSGQDWMISWDTTNVDALMSTIRSVPSKAVWREVARQYEILYKRPLSRDIAEELDSAELSRAIALVKTKPEK
jgi:hypothetical protein